MGFAAESGGQGVFRLSAQGLQALQSPRLRQHAWNMISLSAWRKASFICKKQTPDTVREGAGHGYTASPDRAA